MNEEVLAAVKMIEKERGISAEAIFDAIEASLLAASKSHFGKSENVKVNINRENGQYELTREFEVVKEVEDPSCQITKEEAAARGQNVPLGGFYVERFESQDFGRIASQNAKNVILQKLREEERRSVYDTFSGKLHQVVTGKISHINENSITVNLGKTDAILGDKDQVRTENYMVGKNIKVYVTDVEDGKRGPRIKVSRTHPELVRGLFTNEVAEIQNGIVEIMAIAREAGSRTKMAVWTNDPNVDPIGACVGVNGTRVNAVVDELCGEKIDIISYSDVPAQLIENAISPANVILVLADEDEREAMVIVPDDQLSLAIGKLGQNARLVAKLTNYKIDIKSEQQARDDGTFEEIGYVDQYQEEYEYEEGEGAEEEGYEGEVDGSYSVDPNADESENDQ